MGMAERLGGAIGYVVAALAGLGMVFVFGWLGYRGYRMEQVFQAANARIVETYVLRDTEHDDGQSYDTFRVGCRFAYEVGGEPHESDGYLTGRLDDLAEAEEARTGYPEGAALACWYDPQEPTDVELDPGSPWTGLWAIPGLGFAIVGIAGTIRCLRREDR